MDTVMLSIICLAYNHEKYIKETLDGFISQKSSYKFEVLINDDASSDKTADIIREYEKKFPSIIKPIYQVENQHSKQVNLTLMLLKKAKGKYFAFCEGDDCWTDNKKVQKQVDYLEKNPNCSLCIHNSRRIDELGNTILPNIIVTTKSRVLNCEELIRGGGAFCATNSIMGRMKDVKDVPDYLIELGLDYTWQIFLASKGVTYCFDEFMSSYRVRENASWTSYMNSHYLSHINVHKKIIVMLNKFNEATDESYKKAVLYAIKNENMEIAEIIVLIDDYSIIKTKDYTDWIKKASASAKIKLWAWTHTPHLYKVYRNLRY